MSDIETQEDVIETPSELDALKKRADMMGVKYHPSISLDKLRDKVNNALSDEPKEDEEEQVSAGKKESENAKRLRLRNEATKLIRIRVTCMNPAKKEWDGEIITAGNGLVGTHKKYIPFNADEGWHVPNIIYKQLLQRECQVFVTKRDSRGNTTRQGKLIKEFAIEVLPPLTEEELKELARRQAMANGTADM